MTAVGLGPRTRRLPTGDRERCTADSQAGEAMGGNGSVPPVRAAGKQSSEQRARPVATRGQLQGDCMKETTKDVVLMKASKREVSTPNAPRNAQREFVGVLCRCAGPTHASLPVSVG